MWWCYLLVHIACFEETHVRAWCMDRRFVRNHPIPLLGSDDADIARPCRNLRAKSADLGIQWFQCVVTHPVRQQFDIA
jgi:hypothetical protein